MSRTARRLTRSTPFLGAGLGALLIVYLALRPSPAEEAVSSVFPADLVAAPDPIAGGDCEVLIGSLEELPAGATLSVASAGATIAEVERLSPRALRAGLVIDAEATSVTLRLESGAEVKDVTVAVGATLASQIETTNLSDEEVATGVVAVERSHFIYGFRPLDRGEIALVRVFNEATGEWHQRKFPPPEALPAPYRDVDSDGDGIPDGEDESVRVAHDDFVGIPLAPGPNKLRIVCVRRDGRSSLEELVVSSPI